MKKLTLKQIECLRKGMTGTVRTSFKRGCHLFKGDFSRATVNSLVKRGLMAQRPNTSNAFWTTEQGRIELVERGFVGETV